MLPELSTTITQIVPSECIFCPDKISLTKVDCDKYTVI